MAELFSSRNLQKGGAGFDSRSCLMTQSFVVFGGFHRNLNKYGLGSLRKTLVEGIPPIVPSPTSGQLELNQQPTKVEDFTEKLIGKYEESSTLVIKSQLFILFKLPGAYRETNNICMPNIFLNSPIHAAPQQRQMLLKPYRTLLK